MPKGKKGGKVRDKWREKQWVVVEASASFGSTPIAYIPLTDAKNSLGRVVETTLYDIVKQDPQQYTIKLFFQITNVEGQRASSVFKGYEYAREYLKSLIRRGSSMVDLVRDYTTKDGFVVRVYVVVFTQRRINSSKKHDIRTVAHKIVSEKTASLMYDQFAQEVVLGKIASDIYNEAKKVTSLRHVGLRKTKLIEAKAPVAAAIEMPAQS